MKDIQRLVGIEATQVADLIQNHQDVLQEDEQIVTDISNARLSLEFFMALKKTIGLITKQRTLKHKILQHLGSSIMNKTAVSRQYTKRN